MLKHVVIVGLIVLLGPQLGPNIACADDAIVLPKGKSLIRVEGQFSLPITERFNKDGHLEDLAKDFNTNLDSNVFPSISLVEAAFGLPAGSGTFGKSVVTFNRQINIITVTPAYGVTDNLTIGANIPYAWQRNDVNASVDNSTATLGFNPFVPGGVAPVGFNCGGACPPTPPPTTEDIQNVLVNQFGFKRLESWSHSGWGDIEVGGKYQYFRSEKYRLALTAGVRLPTTKQDDPDNLADNTIGYGGEYALLLRLHQDLIHQKPGIESQLGVPEAGDFFVNTTFRYDYFIPDKEMLRVCSVHNPICADKDEVDRKIGDIVEAEISGSFGIYKGLYLTPLYKYGHKFKDAYKGNQPLPYGDLAIETDYNEHILRVGLTYSTLPLFLENQFFAPLYATIFYRERFAGDNNLFHSRYIGFTVQAIF
jgi:hypothetical protein